VFARDPDAILTLTPHEEEDHLVLEATLRDFPTPDPQVVEFSWPNFIHKPDMEPKLRKPGHTKENKERQDKLSTALIELLKPNSIIGLEVLRDKLNEKINENLSQTAVRNLIKKTKSISVLKTKKGKQNIYSYSDK